MTHAFYHTEPHLSTSTQSTTSTTTITTAERKMYGECTEKDYAWLESRLEDIRFEINSRSTKKICFLASFQLCISWFFLCSDQTTQANHRLLLLICGCQSVQWTNVYKKAFECPITKEAGQCSRNLLNLFGIMWWFLVARCCQRCFFFSNEIISPPLCNHQFNSTKYFCRSIAIFLANCFKESRAKR